jgi:hypothetical protein
MTRTREPKQDAEVSPSAATSRLLSTREPSSLFPLGNEQECPWEGFNQPDISPPTAEVVCTVGCSDFDFFSHFEV